MVPMVIATSVSCPGGCRAGDSDPYINSFGGQSDATGNLRHDAPDPAAGRDHGIGMAASMGAVRLVLCPVRIDRFQNAAVILREEGPRDPSSGV